MKPRLDEHRMMLVYEHEDQEGVVSEVELPAVYEVCERCGGTGKHVNPSIDGNGITDSDWSDWSEEEREGYFKGRYDVTCYECGGKRVVPRVDSEKMTEEQHMVWRSICQFEREMAELDRMEAMERRMGA